jgi:hypothetical protein
MLDFLLTSRPSYVLGIILFRNPPYAKKPGFLSWLAATP